MVDTTTFRTFHRASPNPPGDAVLDQAGAALIDEAPLDQISQNIRARRRALRSDLRGPDAPPVPSPRPPPERHYRSEPLPLEYQLLGLANPQVCSVTGKLGDAAPARLSIGRAGLYHPDGFRPAPWSGLAYDVAAHDRTGLAPGTVILTARGEIAVEALIPGDAALALRGPALLPIIWIGRSMATAPSVEITAGAFGPGRPNQQLRVGADQPIFVDTVPVPARELVNGSTIRHVAPAAAELFHIDVGDAEVLLVAGIPLASGSRS